MVYPVGYCAENCPGHDTAEQARDHFRQYQLDNAEFVDDDPLSQTLHLCEWGDCDQFTAGYVRVMGRTVAKLCAKHRTRTVLEHFVSGGDYATS